MKRIIILAIAVVFACLSASAQKEISMEELLTKPFLDQCDVFTSTFEEMRDELNSSTTFTKETEFMLASTPAYTLLIGSGLHGLAYGCVNIAVFRIKSVDENKRKISLFLELQDIHDIPDVVKSMRENMPKDLQNLGFTIKEEKDNVVSFNSFAGYDSVEIKYLEDRIVFNYTIKIGKSVPSFK